MTANYASTADDTVRAWCDDPKCPRPLDLTVSTIDHARNLAAKHNRENHPGTAPGADLALEVNLTAAAALVVEAHGHNERWPGIRAGQAYAVALNVWGTLTSTEGDAALSLARTLADSPTPVTAAVAPF